MRQEVMTWKRGSFIVAILAVFALAFSLAATSTAVADDDLAAGGTELAPQGTTTWPISVCVQYGTSTPTEVAKYYKAEFSKLKASGTGYVSGLSFDSGAWHVTTATSYVTLEDLLEDAGLQWAKGASVTYSNGTDTQTFTYDDVQDMYFYPNTTSDARDADGSLWSGVVFGLTNTESAVIGTGNTAADTQKSAAGTSVETSAVLAVTGSTSADYKAASGTTVDKARFVSGVTKITVVYPDTTQPVYRLYNPNNGDHHYTTDANERDALSKLGWTYEGISWYSDDAKGAELHRLYNASLTAGTHHYTLDTNERDELVKLGWVYEGISWYGAA